MAERKLGQRALALLGAAAANSGAESSGGANGPPSDVDATLLAERIRRNNPEAAGAADSIAAEIVAQAQAALAKLADENSERSLTDYETLALESVIHVRSRPALRVYDDQLQPLSEFSGSELWQKFIADYEQSILDAAAATGAVRVTMFGSGNPPWTQGSAWLVAPGVVVTNRHVLLQPDLQLVEPRTEGGFRVKADVAIAVDFTSDNRQSAAPVRRNVTGVAYLAPDADPVDIAVLAIEPVDTLTPLDFSPAADAPRNLFVVGHPAPMVYAPDAVQAVFRDLDGRKRVSFGKLFGQAPSGRDLAHDASTVGGYSGAPVVGISDGKVAGLHYYGDPTRGNLAVTSATLRTHPAYGSCRPS